MTQVGSYADPQAEIYTGGYFDQQNVVSQAEGLQDFRRQGQEGHLIIADDRPILVMSFGNRYEGPNPTKYKIEGKFEIPTNYKVIIKWDEDEIVFMTRQGTFGPEFQIVYLPKGPVPEDFTMFEWNANIAEIWDQFLTVIEGKEDRDMRLFNQGPWRTFGVTRDEVQIALKKGTDQKTIVEGILLCADGQDPTDEEYKNYIGWNDETDKDRYEWIVRAFMDEPIPPDYERYITKNNMVYWDHKVPGGGTVWKHPHLEKYHRMLTVARSQKPLPHWKSIMAFRIEFLLSPLNWETEVSGDYPLVETVDNVIEMARIFRVDIKSEPYFVHVLRRALRHYSHIVREKRKVKDVQDFRELMRRYREIVAQFRAAKEEETRKVQKMKVCVQCDCNPPKDAVLFCDQCKDFFCQGCFDRLHNRGRRQNHRRTWVEMGFCAECQESIALFHCVQCADLYCRDCFHEWHVRGGRRNHIPIILRSFNSQTDKLADATLAMGTGGARVLGQAMSPWFCFLDENNVNLYYNIQTSESRRDKPLETINDPIEEGTGGGLSGSWAGSWGSNMFPDPLNSMHGGGGVDRLNLESAF